MSRKITLVMILAAVFASVVILGSVRVSSAIAIGDTIGEELKVKTVDGQEVSLLGEVKGKNRALVFFNTSCNRCLDEIKWLVANFEIDKILLYSIDLRGKRAIDRWKPTHFKDIQGMKIYIDPDFRIPSQFGVSVTPATALIDAKGKVADVLIGYDDKHKKTIQDFLK